MMTTWPTWVVAGAGVLGSSLWIGHLAHLIRHRKLAVYLADLESPPAPGPEGSTVALIVAARDEAGGVEAAVRSMLAEVESDPQARLIAVDDRSTDGTGAILDRLAQGHPRLSVVHVAELPDGWLGKNHALQVGSESPGTDAVWLLFTDGDVLFQAGAVRKAVAFAEGVGVDQITVEPEVDTRSVGERMFVCLFGLLFSIHAPVGRLGDRRSRAYVGIGPFTLVRAEAFRAIGGFGHLKLSVDEDMRLGQALKYAGYSMRLLMGRGAVSFRWQVGTWGMIRGLEKNFFAALNFRLVRALLAAAGTLVLGVAPFAASFAGPTVTRVIAGAGVGAIVAILAGYGRQSRIGWYYGFLLPAASVLMLVALGRSVALAIFRGGVNWRSHLYPLSALKAHVKERDAWLEEIWRSTR